MVKIPVQVEAADVGALPCINDSRVSEAEPQPMDMPSGDASTLRSSDIVDLGANDMGLPGYPRVSLLLAS
jgi:hypothetical protein